MAQLVDITINIKGQSIKQFSSLAISQHIAEHHTFRLVCPAQTVDGDSGTILQSSQDFIGELITIKIGTVKAPDSFKFSGVVTKVQAERYSGYAGDIIISGCSPTILLDAGPNCKSWKKQSLETITREVLKDVPGNLLKQKISPAAKARISYMVQYKESGWQFLNRLSSSFSEWFFYDGQALVMGAHAADKIKLSFGNNLDSFSMAMEVRPAKFQMVGYDVINDKVHQGAPKNIKDKAGLTEFAGHALKKSQQFYNSEPKQWGNHYLTDQNQLDDIINTKAAATACNMVRFNGCSSHPAISLGSSITVDGTNFFTGSEESYGDYKVIAIHHYCDGENQYSNDFQAVPGSLKIPPAPPVEFPYCETQSAKVTDNYDPDGLGRIQVKFHWMEDSEKSPWLRIASPHGGLNKGMYFMPEKDEEVIVGFEGSSPLKPYVIGTVYNGKANAKRIGNDKNDIKQLKTRSGHTIRFDDVENGSITISTPGGHTIFMNDKDKTISITGIEHLKVDTKETVTMNSKKIKFAAEEISMEASKCISMKGKNKVEINSDDKVEIHADNTLNGSAKNIEVKADTELNLKAGSTANLKGGRVNIN